MMADKLALFGGKPVLEGSVAEPWPQYDEAEQDALMEGEAGRAELGGKLDEMRKRMECEIWSRPHVRRCGSRHASGTFFRE